MKLAISNLAWDESENVEIAKLLHKYDVLAIEVALSKVSDIHLFKKFWGDQHIKIVATTSLLFGHPELLLFKDQDTRSQTLKYLVKAVEDAAFVGARTMVFGSPKNRSKQGLADEDASNIAVEFFNKIGKEAKKYGVYFVIEPNPPLYGTDFINTTQEAIQLVKLVNHPNFGVHLDTSTMTINKEGYAKTIAEALPYAHHFHISERGLKPIPSRDTDHAKVAKALKESGYKDWVSIEMPLGQDIDHLEQIEKTLGFVTSVYM
jgi:D-psicose/D-tagatose/L-ribulose 3-epimerase